MGALEEKNSAAKTVSLVMAVTFIGKVLGLYRDRLLAIHYSTGQITLKTFNYMEIYLTKMKLFTDLKTVLVIHLSSLMF